MSVPRCPGAGFERNACSTRSCRIRRLEEGIDSYISGEILVGPFRRWLRSISLEFHLNPPNYFNRTHPEGNGRTRLCSNCRDIARKKVEVRGLTLTAILARSQSRFLVEELRKMAGVCVSNIKSDVYNAFLCLTQQLASSIHSQIKLKT